MTSGAARLRDQRKKVAKAMKHGGPLPASAKQVNKTDSHEVDKCVNPVNILNETGDDDICVEQLLLKGGELDLISNSTLKLNRGRSYGLVGKNGCGKSTLLAEISQGNIPIPEGLSKHYVCKEMEDSDVSVLDAVMCCDAQEKINLEKLIEKSNVESNDHENLCKEFEDKFGPKAEYRAGELLAGFGFDVKMQKKKVKGLSKGWRMRIALARALYVNPDLLLLDNPTKYLDFEASSWLITCLSEFWNILLVSSNSEKLLTEVCDEIIEIQMDKRIIMHYSNNYTGYLAEKSQVKLIEGQQEGASTSGNEFSFAVVPRIPHAPGKVEPPVLQCINVEFAYPNTTELVFKGLHLGLTPDSKIALIGPTGSGKSTFIGLLARDLSPSTGKVSTPARIQRFTDKSLIDVDLEKTGEDHMKNCTQNKSKALWTAAASSFGLQEEVLKLPVKHLSDGQRTRLILAGMAVQKPDILLLDEPSTHLDIDAVSCLAESLKKWNGAVIIAGHDLRLINLACKEVWVCRDHSVTKLVEGIVKYEEEVIKKSDEARAVVKLKASTSEVPVILIGSRERISWPFVCYEKYVDYFANYSIDGSISLDRFKKRKSLLARVPCQSFKEGYLEIPGEVNPGANYRVPTDSGKTFCRTIMKPHWRLRTHDLCFSTFSKKNIYVTPDGVVKFKGLKIVKFSWVQLAENIDSAHDIIKELFSEDGKEPPRDIQLLLGMMKNKKQKQAFFHFHASLVPWANYGAFYVKMYDCLTQKMEEGARDQILLKLPYLDNWSRDPNTNQICQNWTGDMQTNELLNMYYIRHEGRYNRPAPQPLPGHNLLTDEQIKAHKLLVAQDMTGCLRHRVGHRMEHFKGLMKYQAEGSDLAAHVRFPELNCVLQEELYDAEEMADLELEELMKST